MATLAIFVLTLFGILRRPWKMPIWVYSTAGAIILFIFGFVDFADLRFIFNIIWDSSLTLIALIIISFSLQALGFFEWLIFYTLKICHGFSNNAENTAEHLLILKSKTLFIAICFLSFLCSAFLANDGAILILIPLVLGLFLRAKHIDFNQMMAFLFAVSFVCDAASNAFVISNLSNIITAHYFHLNFTDFAKKMALPNIFGFCAALLLFLLFFKNSLKGEIIFKHFQKPKLKGKFFVFYLCLLIIFIGSFFISHHFNIPLSVNCLFFAFLLLGIVFFLKSPKKAWHSVKSAPFGIILFSFGLFVVVFALTKLNMQSHTNAFLNELSQHNFLGIFGIGILSTIGSGIFNNLPMVLFGDLILNDFLMNAENHQFIYAHLLACNIGAKITPIGSLCTLLWLALLSKKGVDFTFKTYCKWSFIFTFPVLFTALFALAFF